MSSSIHDGGVHRSTPETKEAKLWGARFEGSVTDAVEKFTESISYYKALYKHEIMGSRAHAEMLAHQQRTKILPQKKNPDPMELVRGKSALVVGDLASVHVLCKGLPQAYNRDLQLQDLSLAEMKNISPVFDKDVYEFLGAENSIKNFCSYGSTGSECVAAQLNHWVEELGINRD